MSLLAPGSRRRGAAVILGLALAAATTPALAQPPSPGLRPRPNLEALCLSGTWGKPRCVRMADLRRTLDPAAMQKLLSAIDELYRQLGLDPAKDALVSCGGSGPGAVSLAGSLPAGQRVSASVNDIAGLRKRIADCAISSRLGGRRPPGLQPGAGFAGWVDQTVAQMDAGLAECRDSGSSWIAQAPGGSQDDHRKTVGVMDIGTKPPPKETSGAGVEDSLLFVAPAKGNGSGTGGTGMTGWGEAETGDDDGEGEPETPAPASSGCSCTGTPRKAGQPCRDGAECAPTCAEMQARWERFKTTCEQSGWKAYPCVDFLRKLNGCVDITLINPGPDGDLTCPAWGRESGEARRKRAWLESCKRKQWIVTPLPDGGAVCHQRDVPTPARLDICNDPRAMPAPDQCPGGGIAPGNDRPGPRPAPSPDPRQDPSRPPAL